jgi:hypothetical protein
VKKILDVDIQTGAHDPTEDARASMLLYKHLKRDWEEYLDKKKRRFKRKHWPAKDEGGQEEKPVPAEDEGQDIQDLED